MSRVTRKPVYAICEQQSLISVFVVRCLDSIMPLVSISEISRLSLISVAAQTGLCPTLSDTPVFSCDVAQMEKHNNIS